MQFDDMNTSLPPESDVSLDEDGPTLPSAVINFPTVSKPAPNDTTSQKSPNKRPRPARTASRPPRYWDSSFETHFQPVPRRHCRRIQKQKLTGHDDINVGECLKLGRGENKKNRYLRDNKEGIKSATLPYPLMNAKDEESSIETLATYQKRSRTAHLQLKSTQSRALTDHRSAVPRGNEAAEIVISAPPAARRLAQATSADNRLITTATARDRQAAVFSKKSISVSVDREMQCRQQLSKNIRTLRAV